MDLIPGSLADVETMGEIEPAGKTSPLQVASERAEAFISEKRIGERIKHLRLKKTMGLVGTWSSYRSFGELPFAVGDGPG